MRGSGGGGGYDNTVERDSYSSLVNVVTDPAQIAA